MPADGAMNRRNMLRGAVSLGAAATLAPALGGEQAIAEGPRPPEPAPKPKKKPASPKKNERAARAYEIREQAARRQRDMPVPEHVNNGDEKRYDNRIASFSKGLPHNELGLVDLAAYGALVETLKMGSPGDFDKIPMDGPVGLANPQGGYAYSMVGPDSHQCKLGAAPEFASAETAADMVELYWKALTRDVPFAQYGQDPKVAAACADMSKLSAYKGPEMDKAVTPSVLFRGSARGCLVGPYISQFLCQDVPVGSGTFTQKYRVPVAGDDHMTNYDDWLLICRGGTPRTANKYDSTQRYLRSSRDLAEYSHQNYSYQPYLNATLMLLAQGKSAWDPNNPYLKMTTTQAGITFDWTHPLDLVAQVAFAALKAAWFHKWCVHRRVRPEAFGGHVHNHKNGRAKYPIHEELLNSAAVAETMKAYGGAALLPMAYPEGCPTHPAYPSGHATAAGACATVLKAFFDESLVMPNPVEVASDGASLQPYKGDQLTVGNELDKLAFNVAYGRNFGGVHYRSDATSGLLLGQEVAEGVLTDLRTTMVEKFDGFTFTRFDGTKATV